MTPHPSVHGRQHELPAVGVRAAAGANGAPPDVIACWSAKGGAGTTVVAAALALRIAQRSPEGAVLVDAAGDAPAVLGLPEPEGPGLACWLRSEGRRLLHYVVACPGLSVIPRGAGPLDADRADQLAAELARETRPVVVDCGTAADGAAAVLAEHADQSILVTRPCHLALRRFVSAPGAQPTGVVVVREPVRALSTHDVATAVGAPIVAEIDLDPGVARAVDAGQLATRLPASLDASVATILEAISTPDDGFPAVRPSLTPSSQPEQSEVSAW